MSKYKTLILWKARILGALAIMFFLYVLISVKASPDTGEFNMPFNSMMLLLGFATLGYIFAWYREKEGGIIMIVAGCIMGMYMYYNGGSSDTWSFTMYTLPFLVPGLLFWWVGEKRIKE